MRIYNITGGDFLQYGKVEICGVNTAKLRVLSEEEKRALLLAIRDGTAAERKRARNEMIEGNLRLVLSVIQRFTGRGENPDDLFQVGVIGLIKAIDNFDPTLDVRFSTYGVPMMYSGRKESQKADRRALYEYFIYRASRTVGNRIH